MYRLAKINNNRLKIFKMGNSNNNNNINKKPIQKLTENLNLYTKC